MSGVSEAIPAARAHARAGTRKTPWRCRSPDYNLVAVTGRKSVERGGPVEEQGRALQIRATRAISAHSRQAIIVPFNRYIEDSLPRQSPWVSTASYAAPNHSRTGSAAPAPVGPVPWKWARGEDRPGSGDLGLYLASVIHAACLLREGGSAEGGCSVMHCDGRWGNTGAEGVGLGG